MASFWGQLEHLPGALLHGAEQLGQQIGKYTGPSALQQYWDDYSNAITQMSGGGGGGGGGGGDPRQQAAPPPSQFAGTPEQQALTQWLIGRIPQMSFGQLYGQGAQTTGSAIANMLQGLPTADVNKIMAALPAQSNVLGDIKQSAQQPTAGNALNAGLGMFFQQYLAPQMQAMYQTQQNAINQQGQAVQQAFNQPGVTPQMKAALGPMASMMGQLGTEANVAGYNAAANTIPYEQMLQGLSAQTTGYQAMTDAFTKAVTDAVLASGNTAGLQQAIAGMTGGSGNTNASALLGALGVGNAFSPTLGTGTGTSPGAGTNLTTPAIGFTPYAVPGLNG